MLRKIVEKCKSKKEKDVNIDDETKELEINENREVAETNNEKLVVDATNNTPPSQDAMTITTAAASKEVGHKDDMGSKDGDNNDADNTKGEGEGGAIWRSKTATTTIKRTL